MLKQLQFTTFIQLFNFSLKYETIRQSVEIVYFMDLLLYFYLLISYFRFDFAFL